MVEVIGVVASHSSMHAILRYGHGRSDWRGRLTFVHARDPGAWLANDNLEAIGSVGQPVTANGRCFGRYAGADDISRKPVTMLVRGSAVCAITLSSGFKWSGDSPTLGIT